MHGAIYGFGNSQVRFHHLRVDDFLASGIRTHGLKDAKIHECEFIDAGGRWKRGGIPGVDGGISGGAIFCVWTNDTEIFNNRFTRTQSGIENNHYGVKGRQGRNCRIHHNTIEVNFSIEFPFEGDEDMEIDHNVCHGAISIPKYAGGRVPESGRTFHIHHNYMTAGYSIEFVRNGVEIDHNLFDFDSQKDGGNLISGFGKAAADGPAFFHNNLVKNPGRGVIWINEPYNQFTIRNNHIVATTTPTPRTEGLFGFNRECDFSTFQIVNNIIECRGTARPLLRQKESYGAVIRNNRLTNVTDHQEYKNEQTGEVVGLESPLEFKCGMHEEMMVKGWNASMVKSD
jgi:nitrous oxidase accessory protein